MSQKPYAYCDGDPVNNSDPSGHQASAFPTTAETAAHDALMAGIADIQDGGDPKDVTIPLGGLLGYNPSTNGLSYGPVTFQNGSGSLGINQIFSSPVITGNGDFNLGGGDLTLTGNYPLNGSGGSFSGEYDHPISGGLKLTVNFGSGQGPSYGLQYGISF